MCIQTNEYNIMYNGVTLRDLGKRRQSRTARGDGLIGRYVTLKLKAVHFLIFLSQEAIRVCPIKWAVNRNVRMCNCDSTPSYFTYYY